MNALLIQGRLRLILSAIIAGYIIYHLFSFVRKQSSRYQDKLTAAYADFQTREKARIKQAKIEQIKPPKKKAANTQTQKFVEKTTETTKNEEPTKQNKKNIITKTVDKQHTSAQTQDQIDRIIHIAVRLQEKDLADYEKKLIQGLAIDPHHPQVLTMLADHYVDTQNHTKAMTLLKRILDHDDTNHRALRQLGELYIQQNDHQTATIMIEKAIKIQNNNPKYLYSLVDIKYNTGLLNDAIYLMEQILKLRPKNTEYLIGLAMLVEEADQLDRAKKLYFQVLSYEPDNRTAKTKLKHL